MNHAMVSVLYPDLIISYDTKGNAMTISAQTSTHNVFKTFRNTVPSVRSDVIAPDDVPIAPARRSSRANAPTGEGRTRRRDATQEPFTARRRDDDVDDRLGRRLAPYRTRRCGVRERPRPRLRALGRRARLVDRGTMKTRNGRPASPDDVTARRTVRRARARATTAMEDVESRLDRGLMGTSNEDTSVDRLAFRYVFVPWDETRAMEERVMVIPVGQEMECLLNELRAHFRSAGARDGAHAKDEAKQKEILRAQLEGNAGAGGDRVRCRMI